MYNFLLLLKAKVWKSNIFSKLDNITNLHHYETFYNVINEINSFSQYVYTIDENLNFVTFNVLDECRHNHLIKIYIPQEYTLSNKQQLIFETELPLVAKNSLLMVNKFCYFKNFKGNRYVIKF